MMNKDEKRDPWRSEKCRRESFFETTYPRKERSNESLNESPPS